MTSSNQRRGNLPGRLFRPVPYGLPALLVSLLAFVAFVVLLALPWRASLDVGGLYDYPYIQGFHGGEYSQEHEVNFRWTRPEASLRLPGTGRLAPLTLRMHGATPNQSVVLDTGAGKIALRLRSGWQRVMVYPRPARWSGNVRVQLSTVAHTSAADQRERGVVVGQVGAQGTGRSVPLRQVLLLGLSAALVTLLAGWASQREWVGTLAGVVFVAGCSAVLVFDGGTWRLPLTCYTGRLALVLAVGGVVALIARRVLATLSLRGIISLEAASQRRLATVVLLAFLLRFGGMAYPLNFISDIRFSMARATMVWEGELLDLFLPNPSLTPLQWETEATVPRSPFYYILTAPLTRLPGETDRLAMMGVSSAIDAFSVLLVGVLVLQAGGSHLAATSGALLAGSAPLGLLAAVSWGLFPTLLAQCLVLLSLVVWLHLRPRLHEGAPRLLLVGTLALAFLAYPTALLFLGTTGLVLVVLLAFQRDAATLPTLRAGMLALLIALVLFYGWHIPALLTATLPDLLGRAVSDSSSVLHLPPLPNLVNAVWEPLTAKLGPLLLGLAAGGGVLLLVEARQGGRGMAARPLLLAWCITYVPMALMSAYLVTFILKDVLYLLPATAVAAGIFAGRLARSRAGSVVVGVLVALVFWEGLLLELDAIVHAFYQLK